ncbi:MAG TPA: hypothetical protein VGR19_02050 [Allosphingosinicella sp.]|nr:hypothetical protein [Allosphingosinicella sp.]
MDARIMIYLDDEDDTDCSLDRELLMDDIRDYIFDLGWAADEEHRDSFVVPTKSLGPIQLAIEDLIQIGNEWQGSSRISFIKLDYVRYPLVEKLFGK